MAEHVGSKEPPGGRWGIVVTGLTIQLCLGAIYAYGVLRVPLVEHFKTLGLEPTAMEMTWPFIVFLAMFALTMPLAGPYIQKMGPAKVCMIGGALCGIGWLAASFASSPFMLIPLYGIIGGLGVGIAYGAPIATSAQWFPDRRGLAIGLTVLGFGFSSAIISYSSKFMLDAGWGIMDIMRAFGIAFIIITVILSMLLKFPPAGWKPAGWTPPAPAAGAAKKVDFMRHEMTKTKTFIGLWLCYTIGALAGLTAIGISGPVGGEVFEKAGWDPALVFMLILPFAIFNGAGRPIFGSLTDKLTPRNTAMLTYVLILFASLLMYSFYSSGYAYIISFAILWGCLGGWLAIAPTATASYFGMKDNAKNYGLVFTAYGAGAIIGGVVSAQARDLLGAYQPFFLIVAALAVLGMIVSFTLMKPPVHAGE
ncbi:L-lactate MFS transporter [Candidatus Methanocrinis natronophilus]|uniref:OFA family MFS transporter n=1 Tax=Candidatus Methanocrinis natronophilus TaxID=3033396 RepID=A0ABT5X656_9EURY|nr:OFA family MFS transporter [Candidatus Methanocrinis natronophilus]MDF0590174.1 OFA family MFS transporter [Candidatus Methanocrinis natronophilus]